MIKLYGLVLFWVLLIVPSVVLANSQTNFIDHFYSGLLQPIFNADHFLLLTAVGLFIGQQRLNYHLAIMSFVSATLAGFFVGWFLDLIELDVFILGGAGIIGLLIAAGSVVGLFFLTAIAALAGFTLAVDSAQEIVSGQAQLFTLLGCSIGIYLLLLTPMAFADQFKRADWQIIGTRVIGSWIAASSFLVFALYLTKG